MTREEVSAQVWDEVKQQVQQQIAGYTQVTAITNNNNNNDDFDPKLHFFGKQALSK